MRDEAFTFEKLAQIHIGFYKFSDESGDFGGLPHPGLLKPADTMDIEWFKVSQDQVAATTSTIQNINIRYAELGLVSNFRESLDPYINQILSIRPITDGKFGVFRGDTRSVEDHLKRILGFINEAMIQAIRGQHMVMKNQLLSPAELAYLVQQYYVQTHPFSGGNGRTSRFIQELILSSFGLPNGSSGDLMNIDATTTNDEYYKIAMDKNFAELDEVRYCLTQVYASQSFTKWKKLRTLDQSTLDYACRLLE